MSAHTPEPTRAKTLFIWSCGLLAATPIWFGLMLVVVSALGVHGDSGNAALDAVLTFVTLAPGIAALAVAGLAFRADHRWWYLTPTGLVVAVLALFVVPSYLDGQSEPWSLLVPIVAVAPTVVAALWPHRRGPAATAPTTRPSLRGGDAHHVA